MLGTNEWLCASNKQRVVAFYVFSILPFYHFVRLDMFDTCKSVYVWMEAYFTRDNEVVSPIPDWVPRWGRKTVGELRLVPNLKVHQA